MSKIYAFLIVVPFMAILIIKSVLFFDFDTKERYVKDLTDSIVYKVKITGTLTSDEYNDFKIKLNKLAAFDDATIIIQKGSYANGSLGNWSDYSLGSKISRGEAFKIYVKSQNVAIISKFQNGGVSANDQKNLYYKAKGQCRVEKEN